MTLAYAIWPIRFSPDPAAMIDFYSRLGLHKALSHDDGTFATFDGRSGTLGVHEALAPRRPVPCRVMCPEGDEVQIHPAP